MFSPAWRATGQAAEAVLDSARAAPADTAAIAAPDSAAPADTVRPPAPRVVRRFETIEVHAQLHDLLSSETVHMISSTSLRMLPADRLMEVVALKAGVVAQGEDLHVRGGRAGELRVLLDGVELNDPLRGTSMDLPITAVRSADLLTGGLDAEYGGALAGVLDVRTVNPSPTWGGEAQWQSTGALSNRYDRGAARIGGPIGFGLGAVLSGDVVLDGTSLPSLRTNGRRDVLGMSVGWRADNRILGHLKLAPVTTGAPWSLQVAGSRRVFQPYDPMWSWDGYFSYCPDPPGCDQPPTAGTTPQPYFSHYHAANQHTMIDEHRAVAVLALSRAWPGWRATSSLGWMALRSITSLDGRDERAYLDERQAPLWGQAAIPGTNPFFTYQGSEPYFRRAGSDAWTARAALQGQFTANAQLKAGIGGTYEHATMFEVDNPSPGLSRIDSLRAYDAYAPGGFAYLQGRWQSGGMVLSGGVRAQVFTAGPQAHTRDGLRPPAHWSLSPRVGITYPLSVRDAFSLAYVRVEQPPPRDLLYDSRSPGLLIVNTRPEGNGALRPTRLSSYQFALKHLFDGGAAAQLALFYRDLFLVPGVRNLEVQSGQDRLQYTDEDEGHAAGFETSVFHAAGEGFRAELHYTFMNAWGTQSNPEGSPYGPLLLDRAIPIGEHPLDWDLRHTIALSLVWQRPGAVSVAWSTVVQSGAPWTPRETREVATDETQTNSRRLDWTERSSLSVRWQARWMPHLWLGLDVRNVFDWRGDTRVTLDGHPHPRINSLYDDYGAFRDQTGLGGGGYYEDVNGDGIAEWSRVHDPRLTAAPRTARLMAGVRW